MLKPQEFEISYILKSRKYIESRNEDTIHEYRRRFNPSHHPSRYALARFASKFDLGRSTPNTLVASHPKPFVLFPSFIAFGHLFVNVFYMYVCTFSLSSRCTWLDSLYSFSRTGTMVKKRKLRWYVHISRSSCMVKTILQGTVKGARRRISQKKTWEDNIKEWTGMWFGDPLRATEDREGWKGIVGTSSVVPRRPPS